MEKENPPIITIQSRPKDVIDYTIDALVIVSLITFISFNIYELVLRRKLL